MNDKKASLSATASSHKLEGMVSKVIAQQTTILDSLKVSQGARGLKSSFVRSVVISLAVVVGVSVIPLSLWLYLGSPYEQQRANIIAFIASFVHDLLQRPEIKEDAKTYSEIHGAAIWRTFFSRFKWSKRVEAAREVEPAREVGVVASKAITKGRFAQEVTSFAFAVHTLLSSGRSTQDDLLGELSHIGYGDKGLNIAMLRFLTKHGFLTRQSSSYVTRGMWVEIVYYSTYRGAMKECTSGVMLYKIWKLAKKEGSLFQMLS